jgi:monoamine oxidase
VTGPGVHDVVVVGAGLAGLHAALLLEEHGLDVCVLEAQDRVGGRIHSMRQLGSNAEAGGTYIGAGYERVMRCAAKLGVKLIDVTPMLEFFREQDLALGGELIRQSEWPGHPANPFPEPDRRLMPWNYHRVLTMRANPLDGPDAWLEPQHADLDVSMHRWMRAQGLSNDVIEIGYGINTSFGADAHDVSALLLLFRAAFSKAQRAHATGASVGFTAEGGVQSIPDAMAGALQREVVRGSPVVALTQDSDRVRVRCADQRTHVAKRVICALLTGAQLEAVESLPSQPITQVYLRARRPFWEDDGYAPSLFTDGPAGMVAAVRSGTDPMSITHLAAWIMGEKARKLDSLDPDAAGRTVIAALEDLRPAARGQVELLGVQSWGRDPYAAGAWAYFQPGQIRRFAAAMDARHGRLHFCGEHLARASRGMEGAMETAERAVTEAIDRL